jgi:galactokinase
VIRVPGRITLLGEHVDYNQGRSLAAAIDRTVTAEFTNDPAAADLLVTSKGFGRWSSHDEPRQSWQRHVAAVLAEVGPRPGHLSVTSTLPDGAGLSSSAAFLTSVLLALGAQGTTVELARLVQRCEERAGSSVGLLDPLTCLAGRRGHGVLIDFLDESLTLVSIPPSLSFTVVHSEVRRELAHSGYQQRRQECAAVAAELGPWRHINEGDLARLSSSTLQRRARHVLDEERRVERALEALKSDSPQGFGALVTECHWSLSELFDVSLPVIDDLVRTLVSRTGVYGARLVGGGFGGCVLCVHSPDVVVEVEGHRSWPVTIGDGADVDLTLEG